MLQTSQMGSIPPPLVTTSGTLTQGSIVMNTAMTQQIQQQQQQTQQPQQIQAQPKLGSPNHSGPTRIPTPTLTPPATRPATPQKQPINVTAKSLQQQAVAATPVAVKDEPKNVKSVASAATSTADSSTESGSAVGKVQEQLKQSTSRSQTPTPAGSQPKTITIKIDPNQFLCEWRGCLK